MSGELVKTASNYLAETRESAEKRKRRSAQAQCSSNFTVAVRPSERLSGPATTADKEFAALMFWFVLHQGKMNAKEN